MKKFTTRIGTGLLVMGLLGSAFAAPKMGSAKMGSKMSSSKMTSAKMSPSKMSSKKGGKMGVTQMTGTVVSMTPTSLTVAPSQKNKMGALKTVGIPRSAKIMMGSQMVKLSSLKKGEKVTIMMRGGTVTTVRVVAAAKMMKIKMGSKMSSPKMRR